MQGVISELEPDLFSESTRKSVERGGLLISSPNGVRPITTH